MSGRKSTIKDKWIGRKSNETIRNGHVASEMTSHLTTIFSQLVWGEGRREKYTKGEGECAFRVRSSHLSLSFLAIRPAVPGKTRGKVDLHYKSYVWVLEVWSFEKLREVGLFSYLVTSCLKIHENGLGVVSPERGMDFGAIEVESMLDEGAAHGQPTDWFGTIKNCLDCLLDQDGS